MRNMPHTDLDRAAQEAAHWNAVAARSRRAGRDPAGRIDPGKGHERRKLGRTAKLAHDRVARLARELED